MKEKISKPIFPIFFKSQVRADYWKVESLDRGHFIRNIQNADGRYCFQSNDIRQDEIALLMKSEDLDVIDERLYLEAVHKQVSRNNVILKKIEQTFLTYENA